MFERFYHLPSFFYLLKCLHFFRICYSCISYIKISIGGKNYMMAGCDVPTGRRSRLTYRVFLPAFPDSSDTSHNYMLDIKFGHLFYHDSIFIQTEADGENW